MNRDFNDIKRKSLLQVIFAAVGIGIVGIVLFSLVSGPLASPILGLLYNIGAVIGLDVGGIFRTVFADHRMQWAIGLYCVLVAGVIYIAFNRFTTAFTQIGQGIDQLVSETQGDIVLPPELNVMEKKLNGVKNTLKKRLDDAQEAEKRKNDLVMYLAHDIKTPLTSVIGYLSLLSEAQDMPLEQRARYTDITLDKAYRLEQLIDEFFDITRFNLQEISLSTETINIGHMLEQMADEFYPMLHERSLGINVSCEQGLEILGDADKLARVFNNILKNAIAYSNAASVIEIIAMCEEESIVIRFTNTGRTIADTQLSAIFEKFYRLDTARSSATGGSGLGLSIARQIARAHGGDILAQSADGLTSFSVYLPHTTQAILKN